MENGIPNYLKDYVCIKSYPKTLNGKFEIGGIVRCSCGAEDFMIYREREKQSAETRIANKKIHELIQYYRQKCKNNEYISIVNRHSKYYIAKEDFINNEEYLFEDITELNSKLLKNRPVPICLEAVCVNCGKRIVIFNGATNGYNGLLNSSNINYRKDFSMIKKSKCRRCGSESSKIEVHISNIGKQELLSEPGNGLNVSNWEDAFDWLTIDLTCSDCSRIIRKYLDIETM